MKIVATKGLPGSGKSTWVAKFLRDNPGSVRVNKDEIRARLHGSVYTPSNELVVEAERDELVLAALRRGLDVVIDDTNLNPKHIERIHELACEFFDESGVEIEVIEQDFTGVSLEMCIRRDRKRANSVGEDVIRDMHGRFLDDSPRKRGFWRNR
jgi:predicted kinase